MRHWIVWTTIAVAAAMARPAAMSAAATPGCTIDASAPLNFGAYDVFASAPLDSVAGLTIRCGGHVSVSVGLSGLLASGTRSMSGQGDVLSYNVYANAVRSMVAGDGTFGAPPLMIDVPAGTGITAFLYGRIPAGQDVPPGAYGATLLVTLNF